MRTMKELPVGFSQSECVCVSADLKGCDEGWASSLLLRHLSSTLCILIMQINNLQTQRQREVYRL